MKIISAALSAGVLIAAIATLVSCGATVEATSMQYAGVPHPPPSDPAKVAILRREPVAPHERLGEVTVDASTNPAPSVSEIEDKLRQEGAKLGADAVVIVLDRIQPTAVYVSGPWWGRSADTVLGHKLVGVAIKYR